MHITIRIVLLIGCLLAASHIPLMARPNSASTINATSAINATSIKGKVMCGYQGWFRCPDDPAQMGWIHWSRDSKLLTPETLTFEMWPDMREYSASERYTVPGLPYPDGRAAQLFSSDNARTVLRHFIWMRDYGIDGAWLQHFLVDLPGGPNQERYPSRLRVLNHVRAAARQTGRVWALSYDIAGLPADRIYDVLTADWKKNVDSGITADTRYLHQVGKPVVQIWGFYWHNSGNAMTAALANRLIDFFQTSGHYSAFLVGGGDWNWRSNPDPAWQAFYRRFDAYTPWNVGNYSTDAQGVKSASHQTWEADKQACERHGELWIPTVYPGFSWDNLMQKPAGTTLIARRKGHFLWEQFAALATLHATTVYVAMFDEVDEGTAIFKVTNTPPLPGRFVDYEGLPTDTYLRLVGEGAKLLRGQRTLNLKLGLNDVRKNPVSRNR